MFKIMAEALEIASAVISLTQAASTITRLVQDLRHAPDAVVKLREDTVDLQNYVEQIVTLLEYDESLLTVLEVPLAKVARHANVLNAWLESLPKNNARLRAVWIKKQPGVASVLHNLASARSELIASLSLANLYVSQRYEHKLNTSMERFLIGSERPIQLVRSESTSASGCSLSPTHHSTYERLEQHSKRFPSWSDLAVAKFDSMRMTRFCSQHCQCRCHRPFTLRTYDNWLWGGLSIACSSALLPLYRCENPQCKRLAQGYRFNASCKLPGWLCSRALAFSIISGPTQSPMLSLKIQNIIPYRNEWLFFAQGLAFRRDGYEDFTKGHCVEELKTMIIECPSRVNDVNEDGSTALHIAIEYYELANIRLLLQAGADPWWQTWNGSPAAQIFEYYCRYKFSRQGFEEVCPPGLLSDQVQDLPLPHKVVLNFLHADLEKLLRMHPHTLDEKDTTGRTALIWATEIGDVGAVQTLLRYNADANLVDTRGMTAITIALDARPLRGCNPYFRDQSNQREVISLLLQSKPTVTQVDMFGDNILHKLYNAVDIDIKRRLAQFAIEQGVDVNARNILSWTPIHRNAWAWDEEIPLLELLLDAGADINAKDGHGRSALFSAIGIEHNFRHCPRNLQRLLRAGAEYLGTDNEGNTLLHHAARSATIETLVVLIEHGLSGLDCSRKNKFGKTAMDEFTVAGRMFGSPRSVETHDVAASEAFEMLLDKIRFPDEFVDCDLRKHFAEALADYEKEEDWELECAIKERRSSMML